MDENLMFDEIIKLCGYCGFAIDVIANDCNIQQDFVAKMFIATFNVLINKTRDK